MAQYNKQNNSFLPNGTSLFEVVMLADQEGNISTGGGNFSGSAVDAFGSSNWDYQIGLSDASTSDTFTLAVRTGSTSKLAAGMLKWIEY